jgi:hypothetical protein
MIAALRKPLGYALIIISCILFAALPVIPFLDLSSAEKASWGGILFIAAEITWWLGVPLLGKEFLEWMSKAWAWIKGLFAKK